jgi:hypothetical protein
MVRYFAGWTGTMLAVSVVALMLLFAAGGCAGAKSHAKPMAPFAVAPGVDMLDTSVTGGSEDAATWFAHCFDHRQPQCGKFNTLGMAQSVVKSHNDYFHNGRNSAYYDRSPCP